MTVQDALRDLRHRMGLSQEKFARHLDVTTGTIARFEQERQQPGKKWLLRFAGLAEKCGCEDLREVFLKAFADRIKLHYGSPPEDMPSPFLAIRVSEEGEPYGLLVLPFNNYAALREALNGGRA